MREILKKFPIFNGVKRWYSRYERPVSSISLVGGFVFDAVTLKRVDEVWENIWVVGHIVLIVLVMIFINRLENSPGDEKDPEKIHFWAVNALQFLFGGILSVFLIFYFRSAELSSNWPFILILVFAFWANESLKARFTRLTFQVTLLFLSIFSTAIFLLPVLMHRIGDDVFVYSGLLGLVLIGLFLLLLHYLSREKFKKKRKNVILSILGVYFTINFLYFTNLIPPLPISLEDSGVYYSITREGNDYIGKYKYVGLISNILFYPRVSIKDYEELYAYSAVFSPTKFDTNIIHEWQYYDQAKEEWVSKSSVDLRIVGGRDGGFRTYSSHDELLEGKWRVNVLTSSGQIIGRVRFKAVNKDQKGELKTKVLE